MCDVQIVFHGLDRSEAVEKTIREKVEHLKRYEPQLQACKVTVTREGHQLQSPYTVHVEAVAHGHEVFAKRDNPTIAIAINEAFDTMTRNVKEAHDKRLGR